MCWLVPSALIVLLQVTSVYALQPSRCNRTIEAISYSSCVACHIKSFLICSSGSVMVDTTGRFCTYYARVGWVRRPIPGCIHECKRKVAHSECCPGFWGTDCRPCPGLENNKPACYGKGNCSDLTYGNGTCQCNDGFEGFACEKCKDNTKFGDNCDKNCTCINGDCSSGVMGKGTCQPYTCQTGYRGKNCETHEPNCSSNCHKNSHCVLNQVKKVSCECNPGYSGNGSHCEEINPCNEGTSLCLPNAECQYTGPGRHKCVCSKGYTGDGIVCTAIDPCQYNNGNCSNITNTRCNYQGPGLSNCSCLYGFNNYTVGKGCSLIDLCLTSVCDDINAECYMVKASQFGCRCKSGFVQNGTVCYGNILQRIDDLNRDGQYKGKLTSIKRLITLHSSLTRTLAGTGPFTVFIPVNAGLSKSLTAAQHSRIVNNTELGLHFILCHLVPASLNTFDFVLYGNFTTLKGQDAVITNNNSYFYQLRGQPTKTKIITTDITASNGFINIIDFPACVPKINTTSSLTLWQVIDQRPDLLTLKQFIQVAGMRSEFEMVSTPGITFIAPTNEAFKTLDGNATKFLRSSEQGKVKLQAILRNHIFEKKIGITEMIYMSTLFSRSSTLVSVSVKPQGTVILGGTAKLLDTNIPTSNGMLYVSNGLLVPSFVKPIVKKRCDVNASISVYSRCGSCYFTSIYTARCPYNAVSTGKRVGCIYFSYISSRHYRGCKTECTPVVKQCCSGFYGPNCDPCPGTIDQQACYGNGKCFDDMKGNGTCMCNSSYTGTACELCQLKKNFGLSCDKNCTCVHGTCDSGLYGNGMCKPQSCKNGYFGNDCATVMKPCGYSRIPCNINAYCWLKSVIPKCLCNTGYSGDGVNCYRINPCQRANRGGCHRNAICQSPSPGRRICTCINGWTGDGTYCTPIDYCATPSRGFCHPNAMCIFLGPGKVNCECLRGYKGNGKTCQEINPCLYYNGYCSPYTFLAVKVDGSDVYPGICLQAKCIKLGPGQNDCQCRLFYTGNGYDCHPSITVVMMHQKELKTIYHLLKKSNLLTLLASPKLNETIFLPSDVAMNKLNASMKALFDVPLNQYYFVRSNMVSGIYSKTKLKTTSHLRSLVNGLINISVSNTNQILIDGVAKIVVPNVIASNGILHIVDKVLLKIPFPKQPDKADLYQRLCMNQTDFSEMCRVIKKYKLESKLKSLNYCTIFVPENQAFHNLSTEQHENFSLKDLQYHITEHFIPPPTVQGEQQFSTLAGAYYILSLDNKTGALLVNGEHFTYFDSSYNWVIYRISSVLKPVENVCFENSSSQFALSCHSCRFRSSCSSGQGYRYAGIRRCFYRLFGAYFIGCRTICEKSTKVRKCCPGFWGEYCDACPGKKGIPCSGHGTCHDSITGTGVCNCTGNYTGAACEKCVKGHYGDHCKDCNCKNNATCDEKNGFCFCPPTKKGLKCGVNVTEIKCGNATCHKYASCNKTMCQCDEGYEGNGTVCTHVNFCKINNGGCSPNAICRFDPSTLHTTCSCKVNYIGDGVFCQAKNPCHSNPCNSNADCVFFRPGRFYCVCKIGYSGDGKKSCSLVTPCSVNNGGCSVLAQCSSRDVNGTFVITCRCREGYIGNGSVCIGNLMESLQSNPELTEFFSRLTKSDVPEILSPNKNFSIIAPTNTAFVSSSRRKRRSVAEPSETDFNYYVVGCVSMTEEDARTPGRSFVSIAGSILNVTSPWVINNNISILSVHETKNGAIFIVDRMINVSENNFSNNNMSLVEAATKNGYGSFIRIINSNGFGDVVSNHHYAPYTMLWPSDEAFSQLPQNIEDRIRNGANYKDTLRKILDYHIISKTKITTKDILSYSTGMHRRTQEGASLYISCKGQKGDIYINDRSRIVQRDIPFLNGIAFGISEILLPPGVAGFCDEIKKDTVEGDCVFCNGTGHCPRGTILQGVEQTSSCRVQDGYPGCKSTCLNRTLVRKCCKNFYGQDCQGCPGNVRNPCSGKAQCLDGREGNGSCLCEEPYFGKACERCNSANCSTVSKICSGRQYPCSVFAICNASEPHMCECIPGYEGDGFYCQEIDPCQKNNGNCSEHAICTYLGPNHATCRCRPGYAGNGRLCSALPWSHPCATDNGGCNIHASCNEDGTCHCRKNFVGNGIYCGGNLMQVIYDFEELSEFAKAFRQLAYGVEGHRIIRLLSSEAEFIVFAPVNYGVTTKKMTIDELKNHIVAGKTNFLFMSQGTQTFVSLAKNNITVSKSNELRVNNIAGVLRQYPATNGIIYFINQVLPYIKPPKHNTETPPHSRPKTTSSTSAKPEIHARSSNTKTIGITVGVIIVFALILLAVILFIKHRRAAGIRYNNEFGNALFQSEPYGEDSQEDYEDDDYEHPRLEHPSAEDDGGTFIKNPTYVDTEDDLNEHLEMTETSNIVPLTKYDASA